MAKPVAIREMEPVPPATEQRPPNSTVAERSRFALALAWWPFVLLPLLIVQESRALATADTLQAEWGWARLGVPLLVLGLAQLRARWPRWLAAPVLALLAFELFADRATLAYFGRVSGLDLLALAGQLGDVQESAASLVGWFDLALLGGAWSAVLVLMLRRSPPLRARSAGWSLTLGVLVLFPALSEDPGEHVGLSDGEAQHAAVHGLPAAHLRDLGATLLEWWQPSTWPPSQAQRARELLSNTQALNATASPLFGIARDRSVLFVQLEAFQQFVLDAQLPGGALTPQLSRLASQGLRFDRCYDATRLGRTSDAELMVLTGLPAHSRRSTAFHLDARTHWPSLASDLRARGYSTHSLHGFEPRFWNRALAHPLYGIGTLHFREQLASKHPEQDPRLGWGLPDPVFFERAVQRLSSARAPFFALAMTLSSHHPFRRLPKVERFETGLEPNTMADGYLRLVHFSDAALDNLERELRAAQLWEQLVIVFYGDHDAGLDLPARGAVRHALGLDPGAPEHDRVPLVVLVPGRESELLAHVEALRSQPLMLHDLPAMLRDLLGLPPDAEGLGLHPFVPAEQRGVRPLPRGRSFLAGATLHTLDDDLSALSAEQIEKIELLSQQAAEVARISDGLLEWGTPNALNGSAATARLSLPAASSSALREPPRAQVSTLEAQPLPDNERLLMLMPRRENGLAVFLELHNASAAAASWELEFYESDGTLRSVRMAGELAPGARQRVSLPGNALGELPAAYARLRSEPTVHAEQWARFRLESGRYPLVGTRAARWELQLPSGGWQRALLFVSSASDATQNVELEVQQGGRRVLSERRELPGHGAWAELISIEAENGALSVSVLGSDLSVALFAQAVAAGTLWD